MLIGLHGKARSGKDTAYDFIADWVREEQIPLPCRRDAFADRLKISAARALGHAGTNDQCIEFCNIIKVPGWVIRMELHGDLMGQISGREYLQYYGTEAHREVFDTDFWVDAVLHQYKTAADELLVVTDVRFPNEAEAIRKGGGKVWHILRPGNADIDENTHASEQPLDPSLIDHTIVNDRSLDHLRDLVVSQAERMALSWISL